MWNPTIELDGTLVMKSGKIVERARDFCRGTLNSSLARCFMLMNIEMMKGAKTLIETCAGIRGKEEILIVTDTNKTAIANVIAAATRERDLTTVIIIMQPPKVPGQEPSPAVADAMKKADVISIPTTRSIAHTTAVLESRKSGARIVSMAEFTESMMTSGGIEADFLAQKPIVEKIAQLLTDGIVCEVESPFGTCIRMSLKGRRGRALTCIAHEPGGYATPPDIEASIAPIEGSAEGVVLVDGSIAGFGLIREPVKLVVQEGRVTEISGGTEARWLRETLEQANHPDVYKIAELGIGLNPKAKPIGTILEDEGALGVVHIAVGSNYTFGGILKLLCI